METHCPEYECLTLEEKTLVDIEMSKWIESETLKDLLIPMFFFKEAERRTIGMLKRKEKNDKRNRE